MVSNKDRLIYGVGQNLWWVPQLLQGLGGHVCWGVGSPYEIPLLSTAGERAQSDEAAL
jgi:hypothetical protein